jgi:GGDEF domain-containing protein
MLRVTSGWTEQHTAVASLLLVGSVATLAGLADGGWVPVAVAVAVVATAVLSLMLDAWGGALVGLVAVGVLVAVRRSSGVWAREDFVAATVEACAILATGALAGATGSTLRRGTTPGSALSSWQPAYGSLGLLGSDAGMARLEEECARSARHGRPLTLVLFDVVVTARDLTADGRDAVHRTVARLVEHRTGEHDVPFALSADRFGVIFPEAGASAAWDAVGDVIAASATAAFTHGSERTPRPLAEVAGVYVGIAQYAPGRDTWQAMLDAATEALQQARDEGQVSA